jgi:hypothetical protein
MYFMTEPLEPTPQENTVFDIVLKKAVLAEALGAFSARVLDDDVLFRAIGTLLNSDETATEDGPEFLTDFSITPNVKDGKYSLCLEESANIYEGEFNADSGAIGNMFFKFATMKYVPICAIETDETGKRGIVVNKQFIELTLGKDAAIVEPSEDEVVSLEIAVCTVLQGVNDIVDYCLERGVKIVSDEFGSPKLLDELQNTLHISE